MTRVNRAIELLEHGQPAYNVGPSEYGYVDGVEPCGFDAGVRAAETWGDIILVCMEHLPFDILGLSDFMRGLVQGGPCRSGHRTPTVLVETPFAGTDESVVRANAWIVNQVLATGAHGMLLCHAESEAAVAAFVESARYPFHSTGVGRGLGVGRRGSGGQQRGAEIWGVTTDEYLRRADVWPLNPDGEILLGVKIENKRGLVRTEQISRVPGIGFLEWAPMDMSLSLGLLGGHVPPFPAELEQSRLRVRDAAQATGVAYSSAVTSENVMESISESEGLLIAGALSPETANVGRRHSARTMPW